jgi:integrase
MPSAAMAARSIMREKPGADNGAPRREIKSRLPALQGYKLANDGHDTRAIQACLGHRNIQNTTRYTALAPQRFKAFFRD